MNVDSYYVLSVLSGLLQEIGSFLADCLPCFASCVATLLIYKMGEKNMTLFGDMRYNYISEMNNEAISLMRSGLSDEEILAKLREHKFPFQIYTANKKRHLQKMVFAKAVLNNDGMMYKYVIVPRFDKKSFRALKKDMEPILAKYEDNAVNDQAYIDVRYILKDNSPENIERILNALIKWHRKPFLSEGILGTDCKAGLNTTYIYRCLDNLNIWNNNATYERYLQCLATINKVYGNMDIVSSKASISQNLKLIDDEKLNELKNQVSEYLKNKQN